jgi:hypothetical protein
MDADIEGVRAKQKQVAELRVMAFRLLAKAGNETDLSGQEIVEVLLRYLESWKGKEKFINGK